MSSLLRISDAAALAFHAAGLLAACQGQPVSTKKIANVLQASECHLSKVLQRLAKVGMVQSVRGPRGGFSLSRDPEEITLMDVYEAIEGRYVPTECLLKKKVCQGNERMLGGLLADLNRQVGERLSKTTLASIVSVYGPPGKVRV